MILKQNKHRRKWVIAMACFLFFLGLMGSFPDAAYAATSGQGLEQAQNMQIVPTSSKTQKELEKVTQSGGAVLFSDTSAAAAADEPVKVELTYTRTIQYEGFFTRNFRVKISGKTKVAYCVQPKETPPSEGSHVATDYNNKAMMKALYYCWGYPGYDKNLKQYVSKKADDDWSDDDDAYALCHMILSYLYDKGSMSSDAFTGVSADTKKLVVQCADRIESWPDAPTDASISVSPSAASSTWDSANSTQKTQTFKLNTHADNRIIVTVPSKAVLHNVTTGKTYAAGKQVKLYGGESFYFTGNKTLTGSWSSGTLQGSLQEFNPYMIKVSGHQNIIFCGTGDKDSVSFRVNWVQRGWMAAEKKSDDWELARDKIKNIYQDIRFTLSGNGLPSQSLTVNQDGKLQNSSGATKLELMPGSYTLKEIDLPDRYRAPGINVTVTIQPNATTTVPPLSMVNDLKMGKVELKKFWKDTDDPHQSNVLKPEPKITFRVYSYAYDQAGYSYDKIPDFWKAEIITNEKGYALTKDLPYGKYIVEQITRDNTNWKVSNFYVDIAEDTITKEFNIVNEPKYLPIKLQKVDAETDKAIPLADTKFKIRNAVTKEYVKQKILYPTPHEIDVFTTDKSGSCTLPETVKYGDYEVVEIKAPTGYVLNKEPIAFTTDATTEYGQTLTVTFPNMPQKGKLKIKKLGEVLSIKNDRYDFSGTKPLCYAEFKVVAAEDIKTPDGTTRNRKGDVVGKISTDNEGKGELGGLYLGRYDVREIGLYKLVNVYSFTPDDIEAAIEAYRSVLEAEPKASKEAQARCISLQAAWSRYAQRNQPVFINSTEQRIAEFTKLLNNQVCLDQDQNFFDAATHDPVADAQMCQVLKNVIQTLPENQTSTTFIKDDTYQIPDGLIDTVQFKYAGQEIEVVEKETTYLNKLATTKLLFTKKDAQTGETLPNAELQFYDGNKNKIFSGRTDANGILEISRLPAGVYFYQEQKAPEGYLLDDALYRFTVTKEDIDQQRVITCEMGNTLQRGTLTIKKSGEAYQIKDKKEYQYQETDALAHVTFAIVAAQDIKSPNGNMLLEKGSIADTITTDADGSAKTKPLYLGSYLVREVKTPEGYLPAKERDVRLKAENETVELTNQDVSIKNELKKGGVLISKTDLTTDDPLPHAGIRILERDKKEILKGYTDKKGQLSFEKMPVGVYYFQEFDAPRGYRIDKRLFKFTIKENGEIVKCKMTNKLEEGIVKVTISDGNGRIVQTYDDGNLLPYILLLVAAGLTITFLLLRRKKGK
ncbi:SpaA isopeptide-forming pilin-related protein [Clostridiales Family XIII bacterium ASD5510]|uniref:SpaA isopeptide-forming pilin-related protein n=1 Tax=Hominibacterium faecale TaxID=2839743 RepID=A0A9J6QUY6_9FIRM|nr:SpaA isopeptide-forming pilin-related protein [Hominibacterium faecale]MCU7378899.1 SpaA isopeptide-forming pilin-related protein [Hominibacterium faecale]